MNSSPFRGEGFGAFRRENPERRSVQNEVEPVVGEPDLNRTSGSSFLVQFCCELNCVCSVFSHSCKGDCSVLECSHCVHPWLLILSSDLSSICHRDAKFGWTPVFVLNPGGARRKPYQISPCRRGALVPYLSQGVQRPTLSYFVLLFHACPTLSYFFEKCPTLSYFLGDLNLEAYIMYNVW